MKARELRIGNYFKSEAHSSNKLVFLSSILKNEFVGLYDGYGYDKEVHVDSLRPIPLTEEWLLKFGFEWIEPASGYFNKNHAVYLWASGIIEFHPFCTNDEDCQIEIKYIHQLQNLCFALTGEELIIKSLD